MFNCRTYILKNENKADHLPSFMENNNKSCKQIKIMQWKCF